MDRRGFLKSATGVIAAATAGAHAAVAGPRRRSTMGAPGILKGQRCLEVGLEWPDNGQGFADLAQSFAATVWDLTGGALQIVYSAQASRPQGELDGVFGVERLLHGHERASAYFVGLPGNHGLGGRQLHSWVTAGGGQALWDEMAAEISVKPFLVGHSGGPSLIWTNQPLDDRAPLSGLRVIVDGLACDVAVGMGSDVLTGLTVRPGQAMANGRLDLCDAAGLAASVADGLPRVARYLYCPGFYRHGVATAFGLHLSTWQGLSRSQAAVIETAAAITYARSLDWADAHHGLMLAAVRSRQGIEAADPGANMLASINRVSDAVVAHVASADARTRRINSHYLAFKAHRQPDQISAGV